jgi:hypothetical protein
MQLFNVKSGGKSSYHCVLKGTYKRCFLIFKFVFMAILNLHGDKSHN